MDGQKYVTENEQLENEEQSINESKHPLMNIDGPLSDEETLEWLIHEADLAKERVIKQKHFIEEKNVKIVKGTAVITYASRIFSTNESLAKNESDFNRNSNPFG